MTQLDEAAARRFLADLDDLCKRHDVSLLACSCCEGVVVGSGEAGPCLSNVVGNGEDGTTADWCPSGDEYKHEDQWTVSATGKQLVVFEHTAAGLVARCLLCGDEADPVANPPWHGQHIRTIHPEYVTWELVVISELDERTEDAR